MRRRLQHVHVCVTIYACLYMGPSFFLGKRISERAYHKISIHIVRDRDSSHICIRDPGVADERARASAQRLSSRSDSRKKRKDTVSGKMYT